MLLLKSHNQDNLASRKIILCEKFDLKKCYISPMILL
jgi:hypothetical protein